MTPEFDRAFSITVANEGSELDLDANDHGNWTGGFCGVGELKGSRWGISSGSYPHVDIANLTQDQAKAIYWTDYWLKAHCDQMSSPVSVVMFDSAVNNGAGAATMLLQQALGVAADGVMGPQSYAALRRSDPHVVATEFVARRIVRMALLDIWKQDGLGFARRLVTQAKATMT